MKKLVKALLGTACMLCLVLSLNATEGTISVFGICHDSSNRPVSGVQVSSSRGVSALEKSDQDGVYFITGVSQFDNLSYSKSGWNTSTIQITDSNNEQNIDVLMTSK